MQTITVSFSEITAFRSCPLKHWLSYRQRQPDVSGPAADLGTEWHLLMQDWYTGRLEGRSPERLGVEIPARRLTWKPTSEAEQNMIATLLWMWDGWLLNGDPFQYHEILGVEAELRTPLPRVPGQPDDVQFELKTVVDLVARSGRRLSVVDHKSQARFEQANSLAKDMDMDDQLGLYLYAMSARGVAARSMDAVWSYACTTDTKTKPRPPEERFWTVHSARTPQAIRATAIEAAETAMDAYARPLAIEPPRHTDKEACRWRCSHRSRCYFARDAGRSVELSEPTRADQAPLGVRRLYY